MDLPDSITIRADEKAVRNSIIFNWVTIFISGGGAAFLAKPSFDGSDNSISVALSVLIVALIIWLISALLSVNRTQKRQIRDQTILYELTKNGFTSKDGKTYTWFDFKKIYYYKTSVHLLEKEKIVNAVIFSPSGIESQAFKQACIFIKKHAPSEITKSGTYIRN